MSNTNTLVVTQELDVTDRNDRVNAGVIVRELPPGIPTGPLDNDQTIAMNILLLNEASKLAYQQLDFSKATHVTAMASIGTAPAKLAQDNKKMQQDAERNMGADEALRVLNNIYLNQADALNTITNRFTLANPTDGGVIPDINEVDLPAVELVDGETVIDVNDSAQFVNMIQSDS